MGRPVSPRSPSPFGPSFVLHGEIEKAIDLRVNVNGYDRFNALGRLRHVTLRHPGVLDDGMGRRHKDGWTWILSMLAQGLTAHRAASSSD